MARCVRYLFNNKIDYGILREEGIIPLPAPFWQPEMKDIASYLPLADVQLLAPVEPSKIVCVGLNYAKHALELAEKAVVEPVIFLKPITAMIGPEEKIIYPAMSKRVDYEGELAVVIGKTIKNATEAEGQKAIFGYTCANDVTARDLQQKDGQWTRAKSFDTFCPIGPWVVTGVDPADLELTVTLNGKIKQRARTTDMIFSIPYLVSYVSQIMTLYPGDVILTGTPEGIGPMVPGDEVVVTIENIGQLRNTIELT